ncbi:hypothetical protein B0A49_03713 [Cryomyces minteri]|uniref:Altered inheritance of mitochondria protein 21 n=1 Tax=Cryomyces minteri TaxID=331657 RepID=A0A4U0X8I0_9PEZI|nr:hypothetical protein B0A49_03713 [Cryomyces minteri]
MDRSQSPHRASYARSPLNGPPVSMQNTNKGGPYSHSNLSASDLPPRPPSVSLPSIGQEGNEYANFDEPNGDDSPTQTRNIAGNLPLHAPKASVPSSTAKSQISTVTRTDSTQAAAAGIGKARGDDEEGEELPRPASVHNVDGEHGIPEIGLQVPMYPNAGDVQAPSPSPFSQIHPGGIGFHNDGSQRKHGRKLSSRQEFLPPGSYGLHGHGVVPRDQFERAWYEKHPEALNREQGEYSPAITGPRGEWALSSDDLNKLVHDSASRGSGFGTNPNVIGTPSEQIGYIASEEYSSRMHTPFNIAKRSSSSMAHAESPLKRAVFPMNDTKDGAAESENDHAVESEAEDDIIHIDAPAHRHSKYGGGGYDPPTEDLGPHGGNTEEEGGWIVERGYGVPILASDEVAKHPEAEWMQPAISPEQERRGSQYFAGIDSEGAPPPFYQSGRRKSSNSRPTSRPSSRPASVHDGFHGLSRFISHEHREETGTPLEEIDEYEPLFPEDAQGGEKKEERPLSAADKLKRPDLARHHFPSQDVWEDTPTSLQLQTTVDSPQLPEDNDDSPATMKSSMVFEPPEAEQKRKEEVTEEDRASFLTESTKQFAKTHFKPDVLNDIPTRPGMKQRFPSRDIWEDTPDSLYLETTVNSPQMDEVSSPTEARPTTGAMASAQEKAASGADITRDEGRATTGIGATLDKPQVPARPNRTKPTEAQPSIPDRSPQGGTTQPPAELSPPSERANESSPTERKALGLPDRPKPQVPARPAKPLQRGSQEGVPLSKTTSPTSPVSDASSSSTITSPPVPKAKPAVPARPVGGKIASLKAGFLNDLNSRLQLGPQPVPKAPEPVRDETQEAQEKAPLSDARKGRARGPARRKPATSPSGAAAAAAKLTVAQPWTVWQVSEDGDVNVSNTAEDSFASAMEANVASNTNAAAPPAPMANTAKDIAVEEQEIAPHIEESIGAAGDVPEPVLGQSTIEQEKTFLPKASEAAPPPPPSSSASAANASKENAAPTMSETGTQTGQQDLEFGLEGNKEKVTAYLGGRAPEEGHVIIKDGVEHLGDVDSMHGIEKIGHGM